MFQICSNFQGKISKGRYSPINHYISSHDRCSEIYNDQKYTVNKSFKKMLKKSLEVNGLKDVADDSRLMNHFAYQFIREHPVVFEKDLKRLSRGKDFEKPNSWIESLKLEDNAEVLKNTNHFEAIQSTNWNNVRFKPAANFETSNSWLVEFRPMEAPITPKEKEHFVFFATLMQRIMTDRNMETNFYIPISLADKNMLRSVERGAVHNQKFFFRRNFYGPESRDDKFRTSPNNKKQIFKKREKFLKEMMVELSMEELLVGGPNHQGFKGMIQRFVDLNQKELIQAGEIQGEDLIAQIWNSFDFFLKRARNELLTSAALIRKFVSEHPSYGQDSVVEGKVMEDLIQFLLDVQNKNHHPLLF